MPKIVLCVARSKFTAMIGGGVIAAVLGVSVIVGAGFIGARMNPAFTIAADTASHAGS